MYFSLFPNKDFNITLISYNSFPKKTCVFNLTKKQLPSGVLKKSCSEKLSMISRKNPCDRVFYLSKLQM